MNSFVVFQQTFNLIILLTTFPKYITKAIVRLKFYKLFNSNKCYTPMQRQFRKTIKVYTTKSNYSN